MPDDAAARPRAGGQQRRGAGARAPRARRPAAGARVPGGRRDPRAGRVRGDRARRRARDAARPRPTAGSPSTATTTSTASARRRCSCGRCAASGPPSTGTCPIARPTDTASTSTPCAGSPSAARACSSRRTARSAPSARSPQARALGIDVVVTDHHAPRADGSLPDAPIVHPGVCGYPCAELCATAVAHQFARAVYRAWGAAEDPLLEDLDLVALATIADVVPLLGENRTFVRRGLRALATTGKPGLRALMAVAAVDPGRVDERAVALRVVSAAERRRAPASRRRGARADPHRGRGPGGGGRRRARPGQSRAPSHRDADPVRGRGAGGRARRARGVRARRRRLASRGHRDRRRSPRRAPPPPGRVHRPRRRGRTRLGAEHRRVRSAGRPAGLRRASGPPRRPPRRRRSGDRALAAAAFEAAFCRHAEVGPHRAPT